MTRPLDTAGAVLVLIAEDDAPIAAVVAAVVEDLGFHPEMARNGRQALEMARATWPALLLTDLMMPELTGAELIAALRAEAQSMGRPPIPVILMTAAGPHRTSGIDADAVLVKPFDLTVLETLITRFLRGEAPPATSDDTVQER